jgi:hypothetical protein
MKYQLKIFSFVFCFLVCWADFSAQQTKHQAVFCFLVCWADFSAQQTKQQAAAC